MHDKYKKRHQAPKAGDRVRNQIAVEAARRMLATIGPDVGDNSGRLKEATEAEFYTAKRKAAAVLGHRVRPGDLPSDAEVRERVLALALARSRSGSTSEPETETEDDTMEMESDEISTAVMADHLDRFTIYRLRLTPLESVKQNPKYHPEGDALYHSLQVFERAREVRPYDEEFLLAALLHDVGKGIASSDHALASVEALRGAVPDRTLWLIEHHMDLLGSRERSLTPRQRQALEDSDYVEDLKLLRDLDNAGRIAGAPVGTIDEALAYLKGLEEEAYLKD